MKYHLTLLAALLISSAAVNADLNACAGMTGPSKMLCEKQAVESGEKYKSSTKAQSRGLVPLEGFDQHNDMIRQQMRMNDSTYRRDHNRSMIQSHGMGGCTPNFATGGCL